VNLTVTDSGSPANTSNISKNVQVWPTPVANFTTNSPEFYCYNITFKDTTTGGTSPYTYWDFGDGSNSTEQNTSHRYSNPGTYTVTLNVTDLDGCTNSTTKEVEAEDYTSSLEITKSANVTVEREQYR
jgi:PKD repeat protein